MSKKYYLLCLCIVTYCFKYLDILADSPKSSANIQLESRKYANILIEKPNLPRFVSIKSNEVNLRSGPNLNSEIEWIFTKKGEPVEVIAEYDHWRQIRDIKGDIGWVHSSVLSPKRYVVIISEEPISLFDSPQIKSAIIAKVAGHARCELSKCLQNLCKVKCKKYTGWLEKKFLWGVYEDPY